MTNFVERLQHIIDIFYFGKPANLAKTANVNHSLLSRWLNGISTPTLDKLASIEKLGYNVKWLLYGEGEMLLSSNNKVESDNKRTTQLPDLNNMTANEMRELLKWFEANHDKLKTIVDALDSK